MKKSVPNQKLAADARREAEIVREFVERVLLRKEQKQLALAPYNELIYVLREVQEEYEKRAREAK